MALSVCSCKQEPDNKEEIFRKEEAVAIEVLPSPVMGSFYRTESEIWAGWAVHELIVLFITTCLFRISFRVMKRGKIMYFLKLQLLNYVPTKLFVV